MAGTEVNYNFFFVLLVVLEQKPKDSPVYSRAWFLAVLALAGYSVLFAVAVLLVKRYRRGRGHKYNGMYCSVTLHNITCITQHHNFSSAQRDVTFLILREKSNATYAK